MEKITGKEIALSGITAALAVIAVVLSHFVGVLTLTFLALSSVALTLPMMMESLRGSVLAYVAAAGLSFLFVGYVAVMPFVLLFGLYPILDYILWKYLKKRLFVLPIEVAFCCLAFLATFYAIGLTLGDFPIVDTLPDWGKYAVIYVGVAVASVIFHFAFTLLFEVLKKRLAPVLKKK